MALCPGFYYLCYRKINTHIKHTGLWKRALKEHGLEQNLLKAFAGESQAREPVTSSSRARRRRRVTSRSPVSSPRLPSRRRSTPSVSSSSSRAVTWRSRRSYPTGPIGTTAENLLAAAKGEKAGVGRPLPRIRQSRRGGGLHRDRHGLQDDLHRRGRARAPLPEAAEPPRRTAISSSATARSGGSAATAVSSSRPRRLPSSAPPASIRRLTSNPRRRTI